MFRELLFQREWKRYTRKFAINFTESFYIPHVDIEVMKDVAHFICHVSAVLCFASLFSPQCCCCHSTLASNLCVLPRVLPLLD